MGEKIVPTPEQLRELLRYEPDTGKLFWNRRPIGIFATANAYSTWNARYAHSEAFISVCKAGYRTGAIFDKKYYAHRVAWAIHYGMWPDSMIDHINGERQDNCITNLRLATDSQNNFNSKLRSDNKSGLKGTTYSTRDMVWLSRISANGKTHHLGTFDSPESAHAAYAEAAKKYHGEFARVK